MSGLPVEDLNTLTKATSPQALSDALRTLESAWASLWNGVVSELVSDAHDQAADVVSLASELKAITQLKPRLWSLERRMRAFMRCIDITYMMEERSFGDYRLMLEQRIEALSDEADDLLS